jgi:hypothetical protein
MPIPPAIELPAPPSSTSTVAMLNWIVMVLVQIVGWINSNATGPRGSNTAASLENIAIDTERIAWGPDGTARPVPPVAP